ncbi:coiled-coil domain-containing protein [Pseudomonas paeninsulae]|uniref:hypothetical protein n=1 Tax=Pseudomonas paeninsulae TaxID=3110772 RepID=UPI002D78BDAA|nr:hypothetical protein [Pseudomonas sp. IT1137]
MNAATELAVVPPKETALQVFQVVGGLDPWVDKVRIEVDEFLTNLPDMSTVKSRALYASMAHKIAKSKTALDAVGKTLSAEQKEVPRKIDAERKRVWDLLEGWQKEVRRPLDEWEAAEAERVAGHKATLAWLESFLTLSDLQPAADIQALITEVEVLEINQALDEFQVDTARAKDKALVALREKLAARQQHEAELAEIERFKQEQDARAKQDEQDRIAREAAERATREAEQRAQADRDAAVKREAEAAAAAKQRETDLQLQAERAEREKLEAQQRADQAERNAAAKAEQAERNRIAAEQQAAQDKIDAEQRQAEAVERAAAAERQRQVTEKAEAGRQAAAREADTAHKTAVLTSIKEVFMQAGISEEQARAVINLIRRGEVPGVSITY